ncbi:radical SAM protein [Patescibacteria group bacterium]|nr:radical SAM protein [Patescibacteria group bacterium]
MKRLYFASLNNCNEDCLFCVRRGDEPAIDFINTQKAKQILSKKRQEGYEEIYFDGGEPTLRNDLKELIAYAKKEKYKSVNVLTNGVLLSNEKLAKDLLQTGRGNGFTLSFSVSLHSHKKNISEKLVNKKNTFTKTIKGIKNLIDNNAREISIYHIITKYNYCDLPSFVKFINKEFPQIKNITFSFIYPAGAALKNKKIFPQLSKVEPCFRTAADLCQKYKIDFSLSTCGTIPLCFLKGYEDVLLKQQELDQPEKVGLIDAKKDVSYQLATKEFHQKTKVKSLECGQCVFNDNCGGIWKDYVGMYGLSELKPIKPKNKKPNVLLLLTGFSCNNNCVFCSNVADRNFNSPTQELFDKIKKGYQDGFRTIEFIGGEVPIRPDFLELVSFAKKTGFEDIHLTSNGRLFSYPEFIQKVKKAGLKVIVVSLYGHNKRLHESATRTPGSFEQTIQGIKNILAEKEIELIINTVVSKINYQHLAQTGEFLSNLGVKEWHLLELLPDGRAIDNYDIFAVPYQELSPYLKKLGRLAGDKIGRIDFFDFPFCLFGKKMIGNKNINFFTPQKRYEDIEMQAQDESFRIKKIKQKNKVIFQDKYKSKPLFCQKCFYAEQCGGLAKPYYQKYQDREIRKLIKKHG